MNTPTITFSPKSILLVMAYLALSFGFVFLAMSAEEQKMAYDAKVAQEWFHVQRELPQR